MTPKLYENEPIPNNEERTVVLKPLSPLLDETFISNFFRKMAYLCIWSQSPIRNILTTIHVKEVVDLTEFVFRKFRDVTLCDVELNHETPPYKKRKLGELDFIESDQCPESPEKHPDTPPPPNILLNTPPDDQHENFKQAIVVRRTTSHKKLKCQATYKDRIRGFGKDLRPSRRRTSLKKKCSFHLSKSRNLIDSVMLPLDSAHSLGDFFHGCVNFVPVSRLVKFTDIDVAVKAIIQFGKISCIQDHWISKGYTQDRWMGALVTYRFMCDSHRVCNQSYSDTFHGLIPMDVKKHLILIAQMEIRLMVSSSKEMQSDTCVVVSNVPLRASREKLRKDLEMYGELVSCEWSTDKGSKCSTCEVTYRFTVEAYAAALAFDGKRFYRSTLKTRLKMSEKVRRLHLMVSGSYT